MMSYVRKDSNAMRDRLFAGLTPAWANFTQQETEILAAVASPTAGNQSDEQLARRLGITVDTLYATLGGIYEKLGLDNPYQ